MAYQGAVPLHTAIAKAERLAAEVPIGKGEHFTRARRRIREPLIDAGVVAEIDGLVAELLDGAVASTSAGHMTCP